MAFRPFTCAHPGIPGLTLCLLACSSPYNGRYATKRGFGPINDISPLMTFISWGFCLRSKSVNDCLKYQRKIINKDNIEWLRKSKIQRIVGNIHMVHGGWSDSIDEYIREPSEDYF